MDSQHEVYETSVPTDHITNPLAYNNRHQHSLNNSTTTSDRAHQRPSFNNSNNNNNTQYDDTDDNMSLKELIQQNGGEEDETCLVDVGADEEMVVLNKNHVKTRFMQLQQQQSSQHGTSQQGHESLRSFKTSKHKQKAIQEAEEKSRAEASARQYEMHKYLLYFLDPEVEQRYFDFQYVDNDFIPGKVFSMAWTSVPVMSFLYFTEPWYNNASYTVEAFTSIWWIGSYITAALNLTLGVGLHVNRLKPYREIIHLLQLFIGWPAFIMIFAIVKRPHAYTYAQTYGSFFSFLITQARLHKSWPLVVLWPIACLFIITFSVEEYWGNHTYIEMLYWTLTPIPLVLLHFLEKRTRRSFMNRELSLKAIEECEHKTLFTQRMIANFFPETPTRDLLHQINGPRNKSYVNTVLIVTDIVGFTAHTARSDPSEVVDMITNMFQAFNTTAHFFGVEKIANVGDSYCGAVFPTRLLTDAERSMNGLQFSISTLGFAGSNLELRVGVHIGDVMGLFVGSAPPKFDVFGPTVDLTRLLEETGHAGFVHMSYDLAASVGAKDLVGTPLGYICREWDEPAAMSASRDASSLAPTESSPAKEPSTLVRSSSSFSSDTNGIVESLCQLANIPAPPEALPDHEPDFIQHQTGEGDTEFDFHMMFLQFNHKGVEVRYRRYMQSIGVNEFCCRLFLFLASALFLIQLNLQCGEKQDMAVASVIMGILSLMSLYTQFLGGKHRFHAPITSVAYNSIMVLSYLGFTSDCGGLDLRAKYIGDIAVCYGCVALFACQYCMDSPMLHRLIMVTITCTLMVICIAIRRVTYEDEVGVWDATPLCGMCFIITSFFPDYSLRSAFRTSQLLVKQQQAARSRSAAMATSALSIMLPTFVSERLLAMSRSQKEAIEYATQASSYTQSNVSEALAEINFDHISATWEYNHVVICFIRFHSENTKFSFETINRLVQGIEEGVHKYEVRKVKTMGATIMLVGGIEDPRTRQEHVTCMAEAAIVARGLMLNEMTEFPDLTFNIGIHCGPCFGAVIGGNGAIFDLYGDTVNTASRMMTTSINHHIQLSTPARYLLLPHVAEVANLKETVDVKGKGMMEVYRIAPEDTPVTSSYQYGITPHTKLFTDNQPPTFSPSSKKQQRTSTSSMDSTTSRQ